MPPSTTSESKSIKWLDWDAAAFSEAQRARKPILLSIVARWSGACNEMDATTYLDPVVHRLVADRYVPIRIDSDRRPDLNERYNVGGWPSTVFLTPVGDILYGGTYFAPSAFSVALERVADAFRSRSTPPDGRVESTDSATRDLAESSPVPVLSPDETESAVEAWLRGRLDSVHGGFGAAPKYPHFPGVRFLIERFQDRPDALLGDEIVQTLDSMIDGLQDANAGGFFRYANGPGWSDPQPEKILGDQAAWLELLIDAALTFDRADYGRQAGTLADWVVSALGDPDGGFWGSAWGADSREVDRTLFVDQNADMAASLMRAAEALGDRALLETALRSLERVLLITYRPGSGVAHYHDAAEAHIRGLLVDQVRASRALLVAAHATGQVPHVMLAEELMSYAMRTMWDEAHGGFLDRARVEPRSDRENGLLNERFAPFADNCIAARVLLGLARATDKPLYEERAVQALASVGKGREIDFDTAEHASALRDLRLSSRP